MKGSAMKKTLCLVVLMIVFSGCQKFENDASEVAFLIQTGQVFNKGVKTTIVHASSVLSIPNDRLMCVWYGGSDEGEPDTRIWYSLYDQETLALLRESISRLEQIPRHGRPSIVILTTTPKLGVMSVNWLKAMTLEVGGL